MVRQSIDAELPTGVARTERRRAPSFGVGWLNALSSSDWRFPEWLLAAIILTLPLQATKTLFPIQQIEVSRLLMVAAIAWMLLRARSRPWPFPRALTLSVGAIVGLLFVSLAMTQWVDGVLLFLAPSFYVGFALFVATTIRSRSTLALTGAAVIASGVMVALVAIALELVGVYLWREGVLDVLGRANATFGDPNIAARFLVIALITLIGAAALSRGRDRRLNLAIAAWIILFAVGLVLTQSRFGWVTMAVVLPLLVIVIRPRRVAAAYGGLFLVAFIVASLVNGTAAGRAAEFAAGVSYTLGGDVSIEDRGNLTGGEVGTYDPPRTVLGHGLFERLPIDGVRYYLLEAGVAMWEDHPILGVGVGGFRTNLLGPYRGFIPRERLESPVTLPHTFMSQLAAENGLVGVVVVGAFLAVLAWMGFQASRPRDPFLRSASAVAILSILTIFLSSQVAGGFLVEPYLWLAVGALAAIHRLARQETTADPDL